MSIIFTLITSINLPLCIALVAILITNNVVVVSLLKDEKVEKAFLGACPKEKANVLRWVSLSNSDVLQTAMAGLFPLVGYVPYNK